MSEQQRNKPYSKELNIGIDDINTCMNEVKLAEWKLHFSTLVRESKTRIYEIEEKLSNGEISDYEAGQKIINTRHFKDIQVSLLECVEKQLRKVKHRTRALHAEMEFWRKTAKELLTPEEFETLQNYINPKGKSYE